MIKKNENSYKQSYESDGKMGKNKKKNVANNNNENAEIYFNSTPESE
ncbi:hypothetical protein BGM26_05960 [Bacillus sp. FJAT-29790]|nr:hypothetical protein [Bacillus sp. FJAT-29790]MBU8878533.1 hypothetical protein [Bacillus sp. FJAT-29790]